MNFYNWPKPSAISSSKTPKPERNREVLNSFYIFRHGETYETKNGVEYTESSVVTSPVLPEGVTALEKLSEYLAKVETDANFSSPFLRCKQTVEIVEKITKKKFEFDDRLGEFLEIKGEEFDAFAKRIKKFLDEIQTKNFNSVAICTHGAGIAGLKHWILEGKFKSHQLYDFPRPGVLLTIKENRLEAIDFNRS